MTHNTKQPLQYLLSRQARQQADFKISSLPVSYPAQIDKLLDDNMVRVNIRVENEILPKFEVPLATSRYIRLPLQKGDWGLLVPSKFSIKNAIGDDGDMPNIETPTTNMGAFIFLPFSRLPKNQNDPQDKMVWPSADPDTLILSGEKNGVMLQNLWGGDAVLNLTQDGAKLSFKKASVTLKEDAITLSLGAGQVTIKDGEIDIQGQLKINGQSYLSHTHSNGNQGDPTGGVIS